MPIQLPIISFCSTKPDISNEIIIDYLVYNDINLDALISLSLEQGVKTVLGVFGRRTTHILECRHVSSRSRFTL